jgi:hypothetical protein
MLSSFSDSYWAGRRTNTGQNTPVITDGLVMYVDGANRASYSGSGINWADLTANGNDLILQNNNDITWSSRGYFNTGTLGFFDKETGVNVPQGNDPYCMGVWARQPNFWTNAGGLIAIGGYGVPQRSNALRLDQTTSNESFQHYWWGSNPWGGDLTGYKPSLRLNRWFFVAAQYDGTTRSIWVDGRQVASDTPTSGIHNVTSPLIQVSRVDPYALTQRGDMAVAFIYDRALTSLEMRRIFGAYRGRFGL